MYVSLFGHIERSQQEAMLAANAAAMNAAANMAATAMAATAMAEDALSCFLWSVLGFVYGFYGFLFFFSTHGNSWNSLETHRHVYV